MGQLQNISDSLARYKVELTEQQRAQVNQRQFIESMIADLRDAIGDNNEALLKRFVDELPAPVDLSPMVNALDVMLETVTSLVDRFDSFEMPKMPEVKESAPVDLSPVLEKLDGLKFPEVKVPKKSATSWEFNVERDKRGRMIGVKAYPSDVL